MSEALGERWARTVAAQDEALPLALGACAALWGLVAWGEWLGTPLLLPDRAGPVPYLDAAPLALSLIAGSVIWLIVLLPLRAPLLLRLLCALPPASFVLYQIARAL